MLVAGVFAGRNSFFVDGQSNTVSEVPPRWYAKDWTSNKEAAQALSG
jgi:hypothetical protein